MNLTPYLLVVTLFVGTFLFNCTICTDQTPDPNLPRNDPRRRSTGNNNPVGSRERTQPSALPPLPGSHQGAPRQLPPLPLLPPVPSVSSGPSAHSASAFPQSLQAHLTSMTSRRGEASSSSSRDSGVQRLPRLPALPPLPFPSSSSAQSHGASVPALPALPSSAFPQSLQARLSSMTSRRGEASSYKSRDSGVQRLPRLPALPPLPFPSSSSAQSHGASIPAALPALPSSAFPSAAGGTQSFPSLSSSSLSASLQRAATRLRPQHGGASISGTNFGEYRMKQLRDIVQHGGSVQSNDALEYEEYLALRNGQFDEAIVSAYQAQVFALNERIMDFYKRNLSEHKMPAMRALTDGIAHAEKNVLKLVLECKLFMYRQMLEGAPGAWLHFHSFMKDKYKYGRLFAIHECSTLQSSDLDRLINTAILDEHQTNRPSSSVMAQQQKRSYNRIIVEGAGPVGLYAAFTFFLAGSNVLCINERAEYTRNRAIFFDQRWMHQLRYLLGTEFDNLFIRETAPGKINMPEYVGQTNINEMERSLMRRLQSLELYMDQKYGNGQNRLNLRFEQKMVAVRGPKIPIQTRLNFNHAVIEGKRDVKPVDTLVDFLVCAGGANDRIRDKYIGTAIARSETKYYGVVVFVKRLIGRSIFTDLTVFYDADLSQMVPHLQDYQFDQFIADHRHLFSTEFGLKYNGFTKQLGQKNAHKLIIRLFENKITVHIASITPVWADKFFADLQREEHHAPAQQQPQIKFFRHNIEQKWGAALYRLALAHAHPDRLVPLDEGMRHKNLPDRCVEFDVNKVNTTNFPLTIRAVNDAVGLIVNGSVDDNNGGHSTEAKTIAIAVGDANTSPHFMTSSGVSTGRMSVERAAHILRDYHRGLRTEQELIDGLRTGLNSIRERVLAKIAQEVGHLRLIETATPSDDSARTQQLAVEAAGSSSGSIRKSTDGSYQQHDRRSG